MLNWLPPDLAWWQVIALLLLSGLLGFMKTAFGVSGVLITPLMLLVAPARTAVVIGGPINLITDMMTLRHHWRRWDRKTLWAMVPASVIGTALGAWYLALVSPTVLYRTVAAVAISYGGVQLYRNFRARRQLAEAAPTTPRQDRGWGLGLLGVGLGLVGGAISAIAHAGGVLMTIYLLAVGLQKETFIATLVTIFFFQNITKNTVYWYTGVLTWPVVVLALLSVPLLLLGSALGARVVKRLSVGQFAWLISALVFLAGLVLLAK